MPDTQTDEETQESPTQEEEPKEEVKEQPFKLEEELQKEKRYLKEGFLVYIAKNGYDIDTKRKYTIYMNKYKGA